MTHGIDDGRDEDVRAATKGFLTMTWRAPSGQLWEKLENDVMYV